jgi:hypothetical protein
MAVQRKQTCPSCGTNVDRGAVLCIDCGYHLEKGEHLETKRKPFRRTWTQGLPLWAQIVVALILVIGSVVCVVVKGPKWAWVGGVAILAMAALSWSSRRVVVERTPQGNLQLILHGWIFFIPLVHARADLSRYEAVYTSYYGDEESGDSYALQIRGHKVRSVVVWRGGNEQTMKEIVDCLQDDAGLEVRRADD